MCAAADSPPYWGILAGFAKCHSQLPITLLLEHLAWQAVVLQSPPRWASTSKDCIILARVTFSRHMPSLVIAAKVQRRETYGPGPMGYDVSCYQSQFSGSESGCGRVPTWQCPKPNSEESEPGPLEHLKQNTCLYSKSKKANVRTRAHARVNSYVI